MSIRLENTLSCKGKVLHFRYDGGSNPGEHRLVYVFGYKGIGRRTLQCWDFDKKLPRCFSSSLMHDVLLENSVRVVNLANLPSNVDGNDIARGFEQEGYECYFDDDVVVAIKRKKTCVKHEHFRDGTTLMVGVGDTSLAIIMDDKTNTVSLEVKYANVTRCYHQSNPTPIQLRDALNRVIDE